MIASIRPINPGAFGNVVSQQQPQPKMPSQQGDDQMTDYLMNKVEEIKRRLGQGDMGALSNVAEAMRSQG